MKFVILICATLLPCALSSKLNWSKMRPVFRELPNFFAGELKYKIMRITTEDLKLQGNARKERMRELFTKSEIDDIRRNLMLWTDYARAELGKGGSPSKKKLLERLTKVFSAK